MKARRVTPMRRAWVNDLERFGTHTDGCAAVKVIGRFGSRSGLRWSVGDLSACDCPLGRRITEPLAHGGP